MPVFALSQPMPPHPLDDAATRPMPPEVAGPALPHAPHFADRNGNAVIECLADDIDRDLLAEFLEEGRECVAHAEAALLALEGNPSDTEAVNRVFRAFHTVKGTSGFLGLARISACAHDAESLLSRVRDREIAFSRGCADLALQSADMLKSLFAVVARALHGDGRLPVPEGYFALLEALASYVPLRAVDTEPVPLHGPADGVFPAVIAGDIAEAGAEAEESTIRIRIDRFDRLTDLVDELVTAQSMIAQSLIAGEGAVGDSPQYALLRKVTHTSTIVRELQDLSRSLRMVPLGPVFQKLARVVRDTATKVGKPVKFVAEGDEVEIHRTMVDRLGALLVHMVRNAVDHGIEPPAERMAHGKPLPGVIRLRAYRTPGHIGLELSDDGRGLQRERIVRRAIERGLLDSESRLGDVGVFNLIFAPGFSTAEQVTDISGRGVGLDVVRRNLEALHGRVDIRSVAGKGATFILQLPLSQR